MSSIILPNQKPRGGQKAPIVGPNGKPFADGDPMAEVYADKRLPSELTAEEWATIERRVSTAFYRLIVRHSWIGNFILEMTGNRVYVSDPDWMTQTTVDKDGNKQDHSFRTMAVDGRNLYIWPQFVLYHDDAFIRGVLLHEMYHVIFMHPIRGMGYDPVLRNIAMDYSVNLHVNDSAMSMVIGQQRDMTPEDYKRVPYYIPVDRSYCYDTRWRTEDGKPMMWEDIYETIVDELPPEVKQKLNTGNLTIPDLGDLVTGGMGVDHHGPWSVENRMGSPSNPGPNAGFSARDISKWVQSASSSSGAKGMGTIPSNIRRKIDEMLYPPMPWYRLLQNYVDWVTGDPSYIPGDVRFDDPMVWPMDNVDMRYVVATFDTSGSMSPAEIGASVQQAQNMIAGFPGMKGRLYFWDAAVHERMDIDDWRMEVPTEVGGGGGTSLIPQFEALEEDDLVDKTKVVICFTDGFVDWSRFDEEIVSKLNDGTYMFDVLFVFTNEVEHQVPKHLKVKWTRLSVRDHS